jgi:flagellar M-ring protein FliF
LTQLNIPYRTDGGNTILVPSDKVHDARFKLAAQGLPKGSIVGLELLDNQKLGATQFQEQVNFQRGLQGELERSIQTITAVHTARVHLSIPKQSVFLRDAQKPRASVLVNLYPGKSLDPTQLAGIVHLVASSVPELTPKNVSVLDQNGSLLSKNDEISATGLDPSQLEYVKKIELLTSARIANILEPIVGADNYRVQVTADVDFSQSEQSSETYKPNGEATQSALRSQQVSESSSKSADAGGVPGALTNQPAAQPTAPIGQAADPKAAAAAQANGESRKESIVNYEVDKTTRVVRGATGLIKRISAAVVINHRNSKDADGVVTTAPLTAQEIEQINALVREAMGFTKERGDTLNVSNVPFSPVTIPEATETPIWKDPANIDMAKDAAKWLGLLILALVVMKNFIRPAIDAMNAPPQEVVSADGQHTPLLNATVGPDDVEFASLPSPSATRIEQVREMAKNDPRAVANVVKNWVAKE